MFCHFFLWGRGLASRSLRSSMLGHPSPLSSLHQSLTMQGCNGGKEDLINCGVLCCTIKLFQNLPKLAPQLEIFLQFWSAIWTYEFDPFIWFNHCWGLETMEQYQSNEQPSQMHEESRRKTVKNCVIFTIFTVFLRLPSANSPGSEETPDCKSISRRIWAPMLC